MITADSLVDGHSYCIVVFSRFENTGFTYRSAKLVDVDILKALKENFNSLIYYYTRTAASALLRYMEIIRNENDTKIAFTRNYL